MLALFLYPMPQNMHGQYVGIHKNAGNDTMFFIALNPSGGGHMYYIQQPTHAISSKIMCTTHTIGQMTLLTTPPFLMHMVGFEPRFHQCMTHVLPIYLWVE